MNNDGLIGYKKSSISKIKNSLKKTLKKNEDNYIQEESAIELKKNDNLRNNFINNLKVDAKVTNAVIEKRKFLEKINGNEETLKMLSIDRLKKLEKYYNNIIEQNNKKIRNLKKMKYFIDCKIKICYFISIQINNCKKRRDAVC